MLNDNTNFTGKNGFIWWTGIIEDKKDPIKLGRCKVRIVGWHSENKMNLPTDALPWAIPVLPFNNASVFTPKEGEMVFGFFMDGEAAQNPVILGVFPSIPLKEPNSQDGFNDNRSEDLLSSSPRLPKSKTYKDDGTGLELEDNEKASLYPSLLDEPSTSRIARNDEDSIKDTFIQERKDNKLEGVETASGTWDEPETQYGTVYPYNNARETESGHLIEFDDTPGKERIQIAHRTGTFFEIYPDGSKVEKIVKDNFQIIMKDDNIYIMGKCNITVQGNAEVYVKADAFMKVDGNVKVEVGGNVDAEVGGNAKVNVSGNVDVEVGGNYNEKVGGSYNVESGGNMTFKAPKIDLN
jgi:hypothetical protein